MTAEMRQERLSNSLNDREKLMVLVARDQATNLDREQQHELNQILSEVWDTFKPWEHRMMGREFSNLVRMGYVPFRRCGKGSDNHALYCRT